jgi:hypothetical protein
MAGDEEQFARHSSQQDDDDDADDDDDDDDDGAEHYLRCITAINAGSSKPNRCKSDGAILV